MVATALGTVEGMTAQEAFEAPVQLALDSVTTGPPWTLVVLVLLAVVLLWMPEGASSAERQGS